MRYGLLIASGVVLVLGALLYVSLRPSETRAPAIPLAKGVSADPGSTQLSAVPDEERTQAPVEPPGLETPPVVEPTPLPEMRPEEALLPMTDIAAKPGEASVDPLRPQGSEFFEAKYAGRSAKERLAAIDRLRSVLAANEAGTLPPSEALTGEQVQAIHIEIEWLKLNLGS